MQRIDLRDIWTTEASDFTPWLARPENLQVLADTLAMDLELEAQEKAVGPFRADILCKDTGTDDWVLIENQLERTDHAHLGQLLTYAAGLQAVTIVWISGRFTEEHRATLDWLNAITDERFRFFGLEIELWRIGASLAAPKFNIISKPNDWSRSVSHAARSVDEKELSELKLRQRAYWTGLNAALNRLGGVVLGSRKPRARSWMRYSIGRTGFRLAATMLRQSRQVRAEVYIGGDNAAAYFDLLHELGEAIEEELGYALQWVEAPEHRDSRIEVYLEPADPEEEADWPRQHEWLAERLNELHRVFAPRIRDLNAGDWEPDDSA